MLSAIHLFKKYGNLTVVNDVSLTVATGEIVSIVGPSGAGKSTLLHIMGGLDKPNQGKVLINNIDFLLLPSKKEAKFRNSNIGFVFQFHHLLPEFSAIENVCIPLWIKGLSKKDASLQAADMLNIVGLSSKLENKPSELSGGEQQRVAIARALVTKPAVVMTDEPSGNLDSANANSIHHLFLELRNKFNQTFIIVTHNDHLAQMTDRTFTMQDGKVVDEKKN